MSVSGSQDADTVRPQASSGDLRFQREQGRPHAPRLSPLFVCMAHFYMTSFYSIRPHPPPPPHPSLLL